MRRRNTLILIILLLSLKLEAQWTNIDVPSGNFDYLMNIFEIEPNKWWATTLYDIYQSPDSGNSWKNINSLISEISDPYSHIGYNGKFYSENGIYYATTKYGLYYSDDEAATWKSFSLLEGKEIHFFYKSGTNIFVQASGNSLFTSNDNGLTWSFYVLNYQIGVDFYAANDIIYCSGNYNPENKVKIYKSTDFGKNFNFMADINFSSPSGSGYNTIYANGNKLFIYDYDEIFYSSNSGANWENISNMVPYNQIYAFIQFENRLLISTNLGLHTSNDNGVSWTVLHLEGLNVPIRNFHVLSNQLYGTCNNKGLIKIDLQNNLATEKNKGIRSTQRIENFLEIDSKLFIKSIRGWYSSTDEGRNWVKENTILDGKGIFTSGNQFFHVVASNNGWATYYLYNKQSQNWDSINTLISYYDWKIVCDKNEIWMYQNSVSPHLLYSPNLGKTWQEFDPLAGVFPIKNLYYFGGKLYNFHTNGIFISADKGKTMTFQTPQSEFYADDYTRYQFLNFNNKDYIFADYYSFNWYENSQRAILQVSEDYGKNWKLINSFPTLNLVSPPIIPFNNELYIATIGKRADFPWDYVTLLKTSDIGNTWNHVDNNISIDANMKFFVKHNEKLYYVSTDNTLWVNSTDFISDTNNSKKQNEIIIFPNPSNGIFTITVPEGINVAKIEIFDITGKYVYSTSAFKSSDIIQLNLSAYKKGIYFVKMISGDKSWISKAIIN